MPDKPSPTPPRTSSRLSGALRSSARGAWRVLRTLLLSIAAIVIFIEEWGWEPLQAILGRIARWGPLAALEARIRSASPRMALALFGLPAVLLFPLKVAALWLIHAGHGVLGVAIIVLAKLIGTALLGRLFVLTERQLMQFAWFARALQWWLALKARVALWVRETVRRSAAWRALRALRMSLRRQVRRIVKSWKAADS